jgi:DNA invertase Pin-like site-specific DNA recombinase
MQKVAVYVRVSTGEQHPEMQKDELLQYVKQRGWALHKVYSDKISGAKERRPALDQLMSDACRGLFQSVLVWRLDRFARSLRHLVNAIAELESRGISFVSFRDNIDMGTPSGILQMQIVGAMAEFERSLIQERVRAGIARARRNGKRLGRPALRKLTAKEIASLQAERYRNGTPFRVLAKNYGISVWTAHSVCEKNGGLCRR